MTFEDTLGFSLVEGLAAIQEIEAAASRGSEVCACGHTMGRHSQEEGGGHSMCTGGKNTCMCRFPLAVLKVENARVFLRKTSGAGPFHALGQGITSALVNGQTIEWLVGCVDCGAREGLSPVGLEHFNSKLILNEPAKLNKVVCSECRKEYR
jgi:hypothetical protein